LHQIPLSKIMNKIISLLILSIAFFACNNSKKAKSAQIESMGDQPDSMAHYKVLKKISIPGDGGWDYAAFDTLNRRLYVSHSTKVDIVDVDKEQVIGSILNTPGVHGIAFAYELNKGYTSNGKDSSVTIFDLKTMQVVKTVKVTGSNPDCILYDPFSKRVFTFNGKSNNVTALNGETGAIEGTIMLDGKPEFALSNGIGKLYVNIEDKDEVEFINSKELNLGYKIKLDSVQEPSSMTYDITYRRIMIGGGNNLMTILNADNGAKIVCRPIGDGTDAAVFNDDTRTFFSSNRDGTLSVIYQAFKDHYKKCDDVITQKGARTMALDQKKDRIYLPIADFGPPAPAEPGKKERPSIVPGTFGVLVVGRQ